MTASERDIEQVEEYLLDFHRGCYMAIHPWMDGGCLLGTYHKFEDWSSDRPRSRAVIWADLLVPKLVDAMEKMVPKVEDHDFWNGARIICPLCGDSPEMEPSGFKYPRGIERHFEGWGNMKRCTAIVAAIIAAEKYFERISAKKS